jgi:hypothetical protein
MSTFVVTTERSTKVNVRTRRRAVRAASLIAALAGATSFSVAVPAVASAAAGAVYAIGVAPRPPDTPIIGSPPPNGGPKPKTMRVELDAYRLRTATNLQVRLGLHSSVADVPPTSTDDAPPPCTDDPPTSTDGDVPPASTDDRTEFPEPKPQGGVRVLSVA